MYGTEVRTLGLGLHRLTVTITVSIQHPPSTVLVWSGPVSSPPPLKPLSALGSLQSVSSVDTRRTRKSNAHSSQSLNAPGILHHSRCSLYSLGQLPIYTASSQSCFVRALPSSRISKIVLSHCIELRLGQRSSKHSASHQYRTAHNVFASTTSKYTKYPIPIRPRG